MPKLVLPAVDDDPGILRAVERDLRRHDSDGHVVVRAESGAMALKSTLPSVWAKLASGSIASTSRSDSHRNQ